MFFLVCFCACVCVVGVFCLFIFLNKCFTDIFGLLLQPWRNQAVTFHITIRILLKIESTMENEIKGIPKHSGKNTNTSGHYESSYETVICSRGLVYHLQKEEFVKWSGQEQPQKGLTTHSSMHDHFRNFTAFFGNSVFR